MSILKDQEYKQAYEQSIQKIKTNSKKIGVSFPQAAVGNPECYNQETADYWTGGFWGGLVWMGYRALKDPELLELACEIENAQDIPLNEFEHLHHDVGFMWIPTAVCHYRLTHNPRSRVRGFKAASILASRFNLKGQFIRAWNDLSDKNRSGYAIIDCLMNLPLLFWASKESKDPRFYQIACAHADTVLKHFIRENDTVPHIMEFDANTGECLGTVKGQGKSVDSEWSRGQAWAIYGFAIAYRETGKKEYLHTAKKMANHFFEHLPEDKIPYWDFLSDEKDQYAKDSSAACIAASGMLEIASCTPKEQEKEQYTLYGKEILGNLIQQYACFDDSSQGIIKMGTVNYICNRYINVPIIYGDFYFVEALGKLQGLSGLF